MFVKIRVIPLPLQPVTSSENVNKNGTTMMVQTKHQCISVMKEYEAKSLEVTDLYSTIILLCLYP